MRGAVTLKRLSHMYYVCLFYSDRGGEGRPCALDQQQIWKEKQRNVSTPPFRASARNPATQLPSHPFRASQRFDSIPRLNKRRFRVTLNAGVARPAPVCCWYFLAMAAAAATPLQGPRREQSGHPPQ